MKCFGEFINKLRKEICGEVRDDRLSRVIYSLDASHYKKEPGVVIIPKTINDIVNLVQICSEENVPITPRGGGTSLSGQSLGEGVVLDLSKYMDSIEFVDPQNMYAVCQPGVIQDNLNAAAKPYILKFAPDTSTSNRATIGGMIGNNSAGSYSILYGMTADHVISVDTVLSDGSKATFQEISEEDWKIKESLPTLEGKIYQRLGAVLQTYREEIVLRTPKILRNNTGYALHRLLEKPCNPARFLCGSEGTLAIVTSAKVRLVDYPPCSGLIVFHTNTIRDALCMTTIAVKHGPAAVEFIDKTVLDLTRGNISQRENRFFLRGDPGAILAVEFYGKERQEIEHRMDDLEKAFVSAGFRVEAPRLWGSDISRVWALRKAGLGIIMGMGGDGTPTGFVEDTVVPVDALPEYVDLFDKILRRYGTTCVYYGHASVGLIHIRPALNLKKQQDIDIMKEIMEEVSSLVARFGGSLSGEHGDGRVRSPYLKKMVGEKMVEAFGLVKEAFDSKRILNPGIIVDPNTIDTDLRYGTSYHDQEVPTILSFPRGYLRAIELCNGSADCRKGSKAGGTMCPSYHATHEETHTTRARANALRCMITSDGPDKAFASSELAEALELCLSCKGCKAECPANVDMAKLKAEFLYQRFKRTGTPLKNMVFGYFGLLYNMASKFGRLSGLIMSSRLFAFFSEKFLGVDRRRSIPLPALMPFRPAFKKRNDSNNLTPKTETDTVAFFPDLFTNFLEPNIGMAAVDVLESAGYNVILTSLKDSGRTMISQGLLGNAKKIIRDNIPDLVSLAESGVPIIGVEPSEVLTIRDEWLDFFPDEPAVKKISENTFLIEEFLSRKAKEGKLNIPFTDTKRKILLHGHCHQKSLLGIQSCLSMLKLVPSYEVEEIRSGCCGMAGAFGYQHYDVSMAIGEEILFPAIRNRKDAFIAAPGTSCRQQILNGTGIHAYHPVELLAMALAGRREM